MKTTEKIVEKHSYTRKMKNRDLKNNVTSYNLEKKTAQTKYGYIDHTIIGDFRNREYQLYTEE